MPPEKKRNYRQMLAGDPASLRQYYMLTNEQRKQHEKDRKLRLQSDRAAQNSIAEALEQMKTCVQRHRRELDEGAERYAELRPYREMGHRTIAERRLQFHEKMMLENRYYRLAYLRDPSIKDLPIQEQKLLLRKRCTTLFTVKVRILELRYGQIDLVGGMALRERRVRETYAQISARLGRPVSTVYSIVRRYERNLLSLYVKRPSQARPNARKLTQGQMESLTTPEKLREQAHLSLMQRCVLIERQMSVSISSSTLRNVYQQMGVGFLKLHRGWHTSRNDLELRRLRVLFCRKMEAHIAEGREIVYIDETSTNCWAVRNKIWQPRNSVLPLVYFELPKNKEENCTIIGAISNMRSGLVSNITYSTNRETVEYFFRHLDLRHGLEDKVIVMDNHRAHWTEAVKDYVESRGAILEFMPPSSSYFNPIETAWAWVKARWSNELIALQGRQPNKDWMYETLLQICESMPGSVVEKIAHSCEKLMRGYLVENDPPLPGEDLADGEWHQQARKAQALENQQILSQGGGIAGITGIAGAASPANGMTSRKREGAVSKGKETAQRALAFFNSQDVEMDGEN